LGVVAAWVFATVVAMGLAASAVESVRGQVTAVPAIQATTSVPSVDTNSTPTTPPVSTTVAESTTTATTTLPPATSTITLPVTTKEPTATTTTAPQTTTSTTVPPPSTTTTTTTAPGPVRSTHQLIGGQVTISSLEPTVDYVSAVPAGGFSAEIEETGPNEVKVKFESDAHESSFKAKWEDGELDIDIDEEPNDE